MNCRHAENWMDASLDQDGATGHAELEAHLRNCAGCRESWRLLQRSDAALRSPAAVTAPDGMLFEFRMRLGQEAGRAARPQPLPWPLGRQRWMWPAGALALGAVAAFAW